MSPTKIIPRPVVAPSMKPPVPAEERGVMRGVSWNFYDRLTDAINERSSIRVAFDGKDVEIMVVGPLHEGFGDRLGVFISEVCDGLDLDSYGLGSATLKREDVGRGVEADLSYCFDPDKVAACRAAEALGSNDIAAFPIPDLAVEIDISPPKIDRADIYSKLRAPEVWRFSNDAVSIEQLDASGKYVAADASRFLCVRADEVTQWLREGRSTTQPTWKRAVREWTRAVLRPRAGL
jgi:Uma2 family endonuclease